ncbi:Polyadenylate-binding protein-interacting protein 7 [Hibiscus syriacus]|uniref:Polyadenylate-binding protein-interacting protein 7 n=1 Tax=Hibiscus syriacus TaxID=106335 RepID=A0A6A2XKQ0_HIBSY|nr:polyadenylate-binding protein-interacting protein 7-like isoform X1 [Hibiscus syriacus]KAE8676112.1 Polyadenylate-binding protein-interacting protein 7 [Hibiscus syriacus]
MSLSKKGIPQLNTPSKVTTLNPNAAEFVPFSLRSSSSGSSSAIDATRFAISRTIGKAVLDRSESSISNNSDDEAHQFCRCQLPDDITPDFKVINEDDSQESGSGSLSLAGLSLHGGSEESGFPASATGGYIFDNQQLLHHNVNGNVIAENLRHPSSFHGGNPTSASFLYLPAKTWDKQLVTADQLLCNGREGQPYKRNSRHRFAHDSLGEHTIMDGPEMNPVEFLASQFPELATESLAEVYFANGCDLNLTIEMLTQLELQVDGGFSLNLNSKTLSATNLSTLGFPPVTVSDDQSGPTKYAGDYLHHSATPYQSSEKNKILMFKSSSSLPPTGSLNFTSGIKKMTSHDSGVWQYDGNGSPDLIVGSSRNSYRLANTYSASPGTGVYANRLHTHESDHSAPVWPETRDSMANLYSELREESQDNARSRNAYFDQARHGFLIGNKALAKEIRLKGPLQSLHMKAAHGNAEESIYSQRDQVHPEILGGPQRIIDLHGLHVTEAIHMLKYELSVLRSTARAADQRLLVYISVGSGHQARGSRIPARLPVAVQHYLLEEECLDYTEPQPGLLRVVIY